MSGRIMPAMFTRADLDHPRVIDPQSRTLFVIEADAPYAGLVRGQVAIVRGRPTAGFARVLYTLVDGDEGPDDPAGPPASTEPPEGPPVTTVQSENPAAGTITVDPLAPAGEGQPGVDPGFDPQAVASGTVDDAVNAVGDDQVKAAQVLEAEQTKPKPRVTLVDQLQAVLDG